jgi:hypothetical protein
MELALNPGKDHVRKVTSNEINQRIISEIERSILFYSTQSPESIRERIDKIEKEWDVERTLELNASLFALCGIVLASVHNRRWLILSGLVTTFLAQHSIQGWCPPIPLFRKMGIRTQKEIQTERHGLLKILEKKYSTVTN